MTAAFDSPYPLQKYSRAKLRFVLIIFMRVGRIELPSTHWKCVVLPLNHTRKILNYFNTISIHALILLDKKTPNSFFPLLKTERWAVP